MSALSSAIDPTSVSLPNPFEMQTEPLQGFWARLFRLPNVAGLAWAIEKTLSRRHDWQTLTVAELSNLESQYKAAIGNAKSPLTAVFERSARKSPDDAWVGGVAVALSNLVRRFNIGSDATYAIENRSRRMLATFIQQAVRNERYSEGDEANAQEWARKVGLSPNDVTTEAHRQIAECLLGELKQALADDMLSPEEEAKINRLGDLFRTQLDLSTDAVELLRTARALWQVRNGDLPVVSSGLNLQKGEIAHFLGTGEVLEERQRTVRTSVHGGAVRIRIAKGVYYTAGSYHAAPQKEAYHYSYGAGEIVITSKRLIFNGGQKNFSLRFANIVDFDPYTDGVGVRKASGKPLLFKLDATDKLFSEIFIRAIRDGS